MSKIYRFFIYKKLTQYIKDKYQVSRMDDRLFAYLIFFVKYVIDYCMVKTKKGYKIDMSRLEELEKWFR